MSAPAPGFGPEVVEAGPLRRGQVMRVPGAEVAALALDLPGTLRGQAREQVARRQLRDRLGPEAEAAEMRPLAVAGAEADWTRVLVARADLVAAWRDAAGTAGRAVLPDYLCLPAAEGVWTVARTRAGLAARLGPGDGFGAAEAVGLALLERALAQAPPRALLAMGPGLGRARALAEARGVPVEAEPGALAARGLPVPEALAHGEAALDLRRDPQVARARLARRVAAWRWPVALGLVAAGLWAASQIVLIERMRAEAARISAETTALVRAHFVPAGPILDPRVQVARALEARRAAAGGDGRAEAPLVLLNRAALVLAAERARPETLRYDGDGVLAAAVEVADFAAAERLAAALAAAGLAVEVADTRATRAEGGASGVRAELRLRAGAAR